MQIDKYGEDVIMYTDAGLRSSSVEHFLGKKGAVGSIPTEGSMRTLILLREREWKSVIEIRHCGKKEWNKVDKLERYQSPVTKRIYTFLDAQFIMEQGWDEQYCPFELCCGSTRMLNKLVGDNFDGDVIETWLHLNEENELVLQWWDG